MFPFLKRGEGEGEKNLTFCNFCQLLQAKSRVNAVLLGAHCSKNALLTVQEGAFPHKEAKAVLSTQPGQAHQEMLLTTDITLAVVLCSASVMSNLLLLRGSVDLDQKGELFIYGMQIFTKASRLKGAGGAWGLPAPAPGRLVQPYKGSTSPGRNGSSSNTTEHPRPSDTLFNPRHSQGCIPLVPKSLLWRGREQRARSSLL